MTHQRLHDLLEDASADVPRRDLATAALAGARRRRVRRRAGAVAGLAVLGVAAATSLQSPWLLGGGTPVAGGTEAPEEAVEAPVADRFTCPDTIAFPAPEHPEIYGDGPGLGVGTLGADRYQIVSEGSEKVLKVGDADGDLRAWVRLTPTAHGHAIGAYERCTGPDGDDVPVRGRYELGAHGRPMPRPPAELFRPGVGGPRVVGPVVPVDDRAYFNRVGVVDRRTIFAFETRAGAGLAFVEHGRVAGSVWWRTDEGAQDVLGPNFIPMGDPDPRESGFAGWVYYATGQARLSGRLSDGATVEDQTFRGDGWRGTLHVVLAPAADLREVVLDEGGKTTRVYDADR